MRSEREKWQVPESDPAGKASAPGSESIRSPVARSAAASGRTAERAGLIYCGQCGALNPATNHYCAACGATLVDAFHATEGLRVYERADTASRMIEIIPAGTEVALVHDPDAPANFVRVRLQYGRLGYVRVADLQASTHVAEEPLDSRGAGDINMNARGCVTQSGALLALALLLLLTILTLVYISQASVEEQGIVALAACVSLGPLLLITIALYIYARSRDERMEEEVEESSG